MCEDAPARFGAPRSMVRRYLLRALGAFDEWSGVSETQRTAETAGGPTRATHLEQSIRQCQFRGQWTGRSNKLPRMPRTVSL